MESQDLNKNMSNSEYELVHSNDNIHVDESQVIDVKIKLRPTREDKNTIISLYMPIIHVKKTTSIDVKKTTEMWRKCMNRTIHKKIVKPPQYDLGLSSDINHSRDVKLWLQKVKLEKLKKITRVLMRMMSSNIKHTDFIRMIYNFL